MIFYELRDYYPNSIESEMASDAYRPFDLEYYEYYDCNSYEMNLVVENFYFCSLAWRMQ